MVNKGVVALSMPESEELIFVPAQENNKLGKRLPMMPERNIQPQFPFGIFFR